MTVLLDISRGLSHQASIQQTLDHIGSHVDAYFSPKHLAILLLDPETRDLAFALVCGEKMDLFKGKKLRQGQGLAGWVAESGNSLLIENTATDPRFAAQFLTAKTKGCSSLMAVPLKSGDVIYGVLELIDSVSGAAFTAADLRDLKALAEVAALALERAYYFQAMKRMAETDQLTGLPNKRSFQRYMEREIEICKRYGIPSSVLLLTLERMRDLNEEYGMTTVDKIIQELAAVLVASVRKVDVPCRIAPSKFAVIMPNTFRFAALEVAQRINSKIVQQSAMRQFPAFSVKIDVQTGSQDDVLPLHNLSETSTAATQGFRKFRNVAANLFMLLTEEKQSLERRQYYRKKARLSGSFVHAETGRTEEFLLENLSLTGIGFSSLLDHNLHKGDVLRVTFRLDDSRQTEISRVVRVKYTNGLYVGCQFADQKSYDNDLGFYLMR